MPTWLALAAIILPLFTAVFLLTWHSFKQEVLNLLLLVSVVIFSKQLFAWNFTMNKNTSPFYFSLFDTAEFILLSLLFRIPLRHTPLKSWINYVLVAFVSVFITIVMIQPNEKNLAGIQIAEAILLVLLSIIALLNQISSQPIFLFNSYIFWIGGGTLFYYGMLLAIEVLIRHGWFSINERNQKELMLFSFGIFRLLFYLVAALIRPPKKTEEGWNYFKDSSPEPPR